MLSLSMIVRDEAARLKECLASVSGFVDEMVVVDTGSTDDTVRIAEDCGARVHRLPWPGDFAPARNHALDLVQGDWVLVLDADERLRPEAREPLLRLMEEPDALLITLLRREQGALQSPFSRVSRLFRRHPDLRWSRPYHSMVDDSVLEIQAREPRWRILACPGTALDHDGYRPELLAGSDKAARLRRAMEEELRRQPGDPYASAKLAGLELQKGRRRQARELLRRGLAHCPAAAHPERYELLLHLALAQEDPERAVSLYREALSLPLEASVTLAARLNLAGLLAERGGLAEASELVRAAAAVAPEIAAIWFRLGLIERRRGEISAAIDAYRRALSLDSDHAEAWQNLAVALLLAGDIDGARRGFREAIERLHRQGRHEQAGELAQRAGALVKLEG